MGIFYFSIQVVQLSIIFSSFKNKLKAFLFVATQQNKTKTLDSKVSVLISTLFSSYQDQHGGVWPALLHILSANANTFLQV